MRLSLLDCLLDQVKGRFQCEVQRQQPVIRESGHVFCGRQPDEGPGVHMQPGKLDLSRHYISRASRRPTQIEYGPIFNGIPPGVVVGPVRLPGLDPVIENLDLAVRHRVG